LLVRKPLERWRLSFTDNAGSVIGADNGEGSLPERFVWQGHNSYGGMVEDGAYEVLLEAWDKAGNTAKATRQVHRNRSAPGVALAVARDGGELTVGLEHDGKVPLAYWRMEMWTKEGKLLAETDGQELPAKIGIELPATEDPAGLQGFLFVQDVLGNRSRRKVEDLLPKLKTATPVEEKKSSLSETWVDEF
jgi:hypothetical protein